MTPSFIALVALVTHEGDIIVIIRSPFHHALRLVACSMLQRPESMAIDVRLGCLNVKCGLERHTHCVG